MIVMNSGSQLSEMTKIQCSQVARLDGRLWKIARLTPAFLWFCPSFCDLVHVQSVIELFGTVKPCDESCELHKLLQWSFPSKGTIYFREVYILLNFDIFEETNWFFLLFENFNFARLCACLIMPIFLLKKCPSFYKNKPVWRIGHTFHRNLLWVKSG